MSESPIDAVLLEVQRALLAKSAVARDQADRIKQAADGYVRAIEEDLASELAARIGLAPVAPRKAVRAALDLRSILEEIPEIRVASPELGSPRETLPHRDSVREHPLSSASLAPVAPVTPGSSVASAAPVEASTSSSGPVSDERDEPAADLRGRPRAPDPESEALLREFHSVDFDELSDKVFIPYAEEFAARARASQERAGGDSPTDIEGRIIRKLTALAHQRTLPRPIYGLSRHHTGDWLAMARRAHDELERARLSMLTPERLTHRIAIALGGADEPPSRDSREREVDSEAPESFEDPPLELPLVRAAAEKGDVIIVGGVAKAEKLDRIRRRTGIDVEWVPMEEGAGAQTARSLSGRIRNGRLAALVVLEGLIAHKEYEPLIAAARERDLPVVYADKAGKGAMVRAFVDLEDRLRKRQDALAGQAVQAEAGRR